MLIVNETDDLKKGTATVGVSANTLAPPDASRTARSLSTSPTPHHGSRRRSAGNGTRPVARPPEYPGPYASPRDPHAPPA
ncbi:hypothetical protein CG740_20170 [Streptomyces sp. CB01201]|nr:hypothetical protein CG740_20170 [Streptomyces sp. CB01201]